MKKKNVAVVDFGSQYTHQLVLLFRKCKYSCEIVPQTEIYQNLKHYNLIVLSGGPNSVRELIGDELKYWKDFFQKCEESKIPLLGVCYGMQLMAQLGGGLVVSGVQGEYGPQMVHSHTSSFPVWMSHGDEVKELPYGFEKLYWSDDGLIAGMESKSKKWWGLQFHPEVKHTPNGSELIEYFCSSVCHLEKDWSEMSSLQQINQSLKPYADKNILCAFSGGIDSLVAAKLMEGPNLYCFFVDHGLLRLQDLRHIEKLKRETKLNIHVINAQDLFFHRLKNVVDPEAKRKIIGNTFIEVFEQTKKKFEEQEGVAFDYLLQGTLYPDVIESLSTGANKTIKSHHNVGGLPERMAMKLVEPLRSLFKDEVRALGKILGLSSDMIYRHPFPGPGLAIRIMGEVTRERISALQAADEILFQEMNNFELYRKIWQALVVYLPIKTVGVKGDARAYEEVMCLRLVETEDAMTAETSVVPFSFLKKICTRITNEVPGITRVVYDLTSKPPATIEWE